MKIECAKPNITEYSFLKLLTLTIILQHKLPIFENAKLQKDLYKYYDNPNFHFLFEDICKKESIDGNNYVDLQSSIEQAYAWGLLIIIQDNNRLKSIINISKEEAQKEILKFNNTQINAMNDLVTSLYQYPQMNNTRILKNK